MGELKWFFSALIACRKWKVETSPFYIIQSISSHSCSSRKAIKRGTTLVPQSKQRLHKLCFLQKLGRPKPCWDQAGLSSLVNKQVASGLASFSSGLALLASSIVNMTQRIKPVCWRIKPVHRQMNLMILSNYWKSLGQCGKTVSHVSSNRQSFFL